MLAVAAWMRYLRGTDLAGRPVQVQDARADRLQALAHEGGDDPRPLLSERSLFGGLGDDPRVVAELRRALLTLSRHGVETALRADRPERLAA